MKKISVSILNVDDKKEYIYKLKEHNIEIHFDIMDGKFVKPYGVELDNIIEAKKNDIYSDVHLMVERPIQDLYIDNAINYGADAITIHFEISNFEKCLRYLLLKKNELKQQNKDFKIGVAIKPNTDVEQLEKYINLIDKILIMSVEPGYGGQEYIKNTDNKIDKIKNKYNNIIIEVDGGINLEVLKRDSMKKVDEFVIGSAITNSSNTSMQISKIKDIIKNID